jgi:PAS domain S-box-containing protein
MMRLPELVLKVSLALVFLLVVANHGFSLERPNRLRVGGPLAFAPYAYLDGTYTGFSADVVQALGQNLAIDNVLFYPATPGENWRALSENEVDCLHCIRYTPSLSATYIWAGSYLDTASMIFVLNSCFDISRLRDLNGKRVAVLGDDAAYERFKSLPDIQVVLVDSLEKGLEYLRSGRVDAYAGERLSTLRYLGEHKKQAQIKMIGSEVAHAHYGLVVKKNKAALARRLIQALKDMETSGERERIFRQWFGEEIQPQTPLSRRVIRWVFVFVGGSLLVAMIVLGWNLLLQRELELKAIAVEKAHLDQAIAEEKGRFEAIVQSMTEGLMLVDPQGRIAFVNARGAQYLGRQIDDLLGKPLSALKEYLLGVVKDPELLTRKLEHAESYPTRPNVIEYHIVTTRRTDMRLKVFPVSDPKGEFAGRGVLIEDMTHEREIERIKSEFVSIASHELRTPMTSILGFSEIILTQELPAELGRRYTEQIHKEAERLTRILNDMLDISYLESGEGILDKKQIKISGLVQDVVNAFHAQLKDRREIHIAVQSQVETLPGDRDKLTQVLWNLLSNADKYSLPGKEIRIEIAQHETLNPQWEIPADESENLLPLLEIRVVDFGQGIPADQLSLIFIPFHRVETAVHTIRGTGLGLAIVKRIVEAHGGRVWAWSELGQQTVFTVLLPIRPQPVL